MRAPRAGLIGLLVLAATASPAAGQVVVGQFATPCGYSHSLHDDPIVAPGVPGASHLHDFLGNTSTNAASTLETLRAGGTACFRTADTAAYWVPALYQGNRVVRPENAQIYYRAANKEPASIVAFPAGLKVIAGDARATAPQDRRVVRWHCGGGAPGIPTGGTVPICLPGSRLVMSIHFPDCWDGASLDSTDHKSHLAYATPSRGRRVCPASHPVPVPRITLNVRYATFGGPGVRLSSGSPDTAHADFFNAWDQSALERLVDACIRANRVCARSEPRSARRRRS